MRSPWAASVCGAWGGTAAGGGHVWGWEAQGCPRVELEVAPGSGVGGMGFWCLQGTQYIWGWGSCVCRVQGWRESGFVGLLWGLGNPHGVGWGLWNPMYVGLGMGASGCRGEHGAGIPTWVRCGAAGSRAQGWGGPTCGCGPIGWAGGGHRVPTLSPPSRGECGLGSDLPPGCCGVGPGAGEKGVCAPPSPPNPALSRCAAGDTGRGMAPTCPQMPSAPSPGSDWVGREPGDPERTPLLPPRDFAYVARDPLTQVLKCHVFRCEGPASAIAAGLHRVCAQLTAERRSARAAGNGLGTDPPRLGDPPLQVEFPAPKSEVVQRFPVCYLGCVPVAKQWAWM
uniref:PID domain-containing protein n=1 Tax=Corvus moneduloides TaxID=1196302 RepID=A0A8U7MEA3_CORMO